MADQEVLKNAIQKLSTQILEQLDGNSRSILENWNEKKQAYNSDEYIYKVRDKEIRVPTFTKSLSHTRIPRVVLPKYKDWGDILKWTLQENVPGSFPYTAGVYPFKRDEEDPTRMLSLIHI